MLWGYRRRTRLLSHLLNLPSRVKVNGEWLFTKRRLAGDG